MSIILIPLGAWFYAYALWYIPIVFLSLLALAFLIMGLGSVINLARTTNTAIQVSMRVFCGVFALYISWAIWLGLAINFQGYQSFLILSFPITHADYSVVFELLTHPKEIFSLMQKVAVVGTWEIRDINVSGVPFYLVWIAEPLIVLVGSVKINDAT